MLAYSQAIFQSYSHLPAEALKAEATPPFWYRDAATLQEILSNAWDQVSVSTRQQLIAAFEAGDTALIERLLNDLPDLGTHMTAILGTQPDAVFTSLLTKAETFWRLYAVTNGIAEPAPFLATSRQKLIEIQAEQVKRFAEKYPERLLQPEIQRQLDYLTSTTHPDPLMISTVRDRIEMIMKRPDRYWTDLSDTHIARIWHADGVSYASQNGIKRGRIVGPIDQKTCPVCLHMVGLPVDIAVAKAKFDADLAIEDPEKYVEAWKFPRLPDVDNIDRETLGAKGFLPPFHGRCRHSIAWFSAG